MFYKVILHFVKRTDFHLHNYIAHNAIAVRRTKQQTTNQHVILSLAVLRNHAPRHRSEEKEARAAVVVCWLINIAAQLSLFVG